MVRGIQGLGAAGLSPATLSTITRTLTEATERNNALGIWEGRPALGPPPEYSLAAC